MPEEASITSTPSLRHGVFIATSAMRWSVNPLPELQALCRTVEAAGFDFVSFPQHLSIPPDHVAALGRNWRDPIALCATALASTTRLKVVSTVVVAPVYPLVLLQHKVSTLAWLGGGRFELGLGAGYLRADFSSDEHFTARFRLLRHAVHAVHEAEPDLPLWIGGRGVASAALARRVGATWVPSEAPRDLVEAEIRQNTQTVPISGWFDPESACEDISRWRLAGASGVLLRLNARSPKALGIAAEAVAAGLYPARDGAPLPVLSRPERG